MLKQGQLIHFMHLASFKYVLENITKPDVFRAYRKSGVCFQGVWKETSGVKWVKTSCLDVKEIFSAKIFADVVNIY